MAKTVKEKKVIAGKRITRISTLSSMYDNGSIIELHSKNKTYRMNISEFKKVLDEVEFEVEQKTKYGWLTLKKIEW